MQVRGEECGQRHGGCHVKTPEVSGDPQSDETGWENLPQLLLKEPALLAPGLRMSSPQSGERTSVWSEATWSGATFPGSLGHQRKCVVLCWPSAHHLRPDVTVFAKDLGDSCPGDVQVPGLGQPAPQVPQGQTEETPPPVVLELSPGTAH